MSNFLERLEAEKLELKIKLDKLRAFIRSDRFGELGKTQKYLLVVQADKMSGYLHCLISRLEDLNKDRNE